MWANFHSHSRFCDGAGNLSDYADKAVEDKLMSIGFSSHAPVPFACKWCMKEENFAEYLREADKVKQNYPSLQIYKGLEVDYVPGKVSVQDFNDKLDYTVGSIHFTDQFQDGRRWEIDGSPLVFQEGLDKIFSGNIKDAVVRYFELTREMIDKACPSVIGHLDKIKIQNPAGKYFSEADHWYQEQVIKTLDLITQAQVIVEVNTRGLYQKKSTTPYPSPWILELMRSRHIPITLSSDAHRPSDLTNQFEETATLLFTLGFRKISILLDGTWKPVNLTPHGLEP